LGKSKSKSCISKNIQSPSAIEVYESKFDKCCPIAEVHIRDEDVQVHDKGEEEQI